MTDMARRLLNEEEWLRGCEKWLAGCARAADAMAEAAARIAELEAEVEAHNREWDGACEAAGHSRASSAPLASTIDKMRQQLASANATLARLREVLTNVKEAIDNANPDVLCDTLWMHTTCPETVVDYIGAAIRKEDAP